MIEELSRENILISFYPLLEELKEKAEDPKYLTEILDQMQNKALIEAENPQRVVHALDSLKEFL